MRLKTIATCLLFICLWGVEGVKAGSLDDRYGVLDLPSHIKYYEVDERDRVMLNPYLQVATKRHKAILDPSTPAYDWVIDAQGNVRIIEMAPHPRGRSYSGRFTRPEDGYTRELGYVERYGHVSALGGEAGRIGGEIVNDSQSKQWVVNNKSGRYSKRKIDRTTEQLGYAAARIQEVVDPGEGQEWGAVVYLLDYAPLAVRQLQMANPLIEYIDPESEKRPYLLIEPIWTKK